MSDEVFDNLLDNSTVASGWHEWLDFFDQELGKDEHHKEIVKILRDSLPAPDDELLYVNDIHVFITWVIRILHAASANYPEKTENTKKLIKSAVDKA